MIWICPSLIASCGHKERVSSQINLSIDGCAAKTSCETFLHWMVLFILVHTDQTADVHAKRSIDIDDDINDLRLFAPLAIHRDP